MSAPIVFISRNRVKEGHLDAYSQYYRETVVQIRADKPGTVMHLAFASEDGSELTIIHAFPDADAMRRHMVGVSELAREAYHHIESVRLEVYGPVPDEVVAGMRAITGSGVELVVVPQAIGGYMRLGT